MTTPHADRNLLVGILALQMDFIDRDQLVAGMRRWLEDKSQSLDAIFADQQVIDSDTRQLLAALVEKHLQLHENKVEQSLASVGVASRVLAMLEQLGDGDIDRTLMYASGTKEDERSADAGATTALYVGADARRGSRFRVLRQHDRGGIGTVSVAVDDELNREVALKEIQERFAGDDMARERFTLEAEITGGLEHPGIVPVYGFGHYEDGRPYYAMRFIRGDNLKQAIRRYHDGDRPSLDLGGRSVEFRRLLGHIVDVCHAMQYAHCRGVLHRDLKPGNIMLGKYGETLVVDWGLAKTSLRPESTPLTDEAPLHPVFSSGTDQTRQGTHLGTPAFMSPEQAEGRLDLIDARSDVYSLGATLFELLAGKRAFRGDSVATTLMKVRRGEFPPPIKVNPATPPALNAICMKAMALRPVDRYQSVAELGQDIEHYLADEPITAWKEPFAVRARRWIKRHRTFVTSSAAAIMAALVILTVAVGLLNAAKNRESRQRQRAEENLAVAKQAVDVMLAEVGGKELENVPQMEEVRGKLLVKARDLYGKLRDQTSNDPALRLETALANKRLGDIFRFMGEVEPAEEAYRMGIEQLQALHQEFPDEPVHQQQLANTYNYLGVLYKKFDREKALDTYNRTLDLQSDLVDRFPDNPIYREEFARSHINRGIVYMADTSAAAAAEADFRAAIGHLQELLRDRPTDADLATCRQELAWSYSNLAILQRSQGKLTEARENYQQAIAVAEPLVADFPDKREYKKELALFYNNLSNLLAAMSDEASVESAQTANSQSLAIYEDLAAAVPEVRSELGNIHHSRGVILTKLKQPAEAQAEFELAREIFVPLVDEFPEFAAYTDRLGNALFELAKLQYAEGKDAVQAENLPLAREALDRAHELVGQAIERHQSIVERYPLDPSYREHLGSDLYLNAWIYKQLLAVDADSVDRVQVAAAAKQLAKFSPDSQAHQELAAELLSGEETASVDPTPKEAPTGN